MPDVSPEMVKLVAIPGGMPMVKLSQVHAFCCDCPRQLWTGVVEESQHPNWAPGDRAVWAAQMNFFMLPINRVTGEHAAIVPSCNLIGRVELPSDSLN